MGPTGDPNSVPCLTPFENKALQIFYTCPCYFLVYSSVQTGKEQTSYNLYSINNKSGRQRSEIIYVNKLVSSGPIEQMFSQHLALSPSLV